MHYRVLLPQEPPPTKPDAFIFAPERKGGRKVRATNCLINHHCQVQRAHWPAGKVQGHYGNGDPQQTTYNMNHLTASAVRENQGKRSLLPASPFLSSLLKETKFHRGFSGKTRSFCLGLHLHLYFSKADFGSQKAHIKRGAELELLLNAKYLGE